jgi:hypothetical protein
MEWYADPAWDEASRHEFERRLRRTRSHTRPQYLRVKARALRAVGETRGAVQLCERILVDPGPFPDFELPPTHQMLGDMARDRRDWDEAERHYRHILTTWERPQRTTGTVQIALADVLSRRPDRRSRDEALALLADYLADETKVKWHSAMFDWHLVRMRLAAAEADDALVRSEARAALELVDSSPQIPSHPEAGRADTTTDVMEYLRRVADSGTLDVR